MNVLVMGSGIDRLEVIRALREISSEDNVEFVDAKDIENNGDIELVQFDSVTDLEIPKGFNYTRPKQNDQWRGGSRGKGGKTKWPRRW